MAYSQKQWDLIQACYEAGMTLDEIVGRDDVLVKSKGSISKRAKAYNWVKSKNETLINREYQAKQELEHIKEEKETKSEQEKEIIREVVDSKVRYAEFFEKSALKGQQKANILLDDAETMQEVVQHSNATATNKKTILGSTPDTAIQINNTKEGLKPFSGLYGVIESKPE